MPHKSRWQVEIPKCSLPTLVFQSATAPLDDKKACFLDAARPDTHYFTPSTYRLWCQRFALGLLSSGRFERGDRLLLFSGNDLFYPVVFMGVIMAGGIFTGANPSYVARELAYQLKDSDAKFLLCAESSMETALEAARLVGMPNENVFTFDGAVYDESASSSRPEQGGNRHWGELFAAPEDAKTFEWEDLPWPEDACHRTVALNYSSGTTGYMTPYTTSSHLFARAASQDVELMFGISRSAKRGRNHPRQLHQQLSAIHLHRLSQARL